MIMKMIITISDSDNDNESKKHNNNNRYNDKVDGNKKDESQLNPVIFVSGIS